MRLGNFLRSLAPGDDTQLAADLSTQRRAGHRRSIPEAAAEGQAWEDADRARDRRGDRDTNWDD
ncbi:hypothetical protein ABT063_24705 [Streptomyces sp. NPDC002838]|uniref:hypothetical protein n=1 Tax=Streptomyces sp. NPDC002838 TaxID=3154436 RepID=UPI00331C183A